MFFALMDGHVNSLTEIKANIPTIWDQDIKHIVSLK